MTVSKKKAMDAKPKSKDKVHKFLFSGIKPLFLEKPHKAPAKIPRTKDQHSHRRTLGRHSE